MFIFLELHALFFFLGQVCLSASLQMYSTSQEGNYYEEWRKIIEASDERLTNSQSYF